MELFVLCIYSIYLLISVHEIGYNYNNDQVFHRRIRYMNNKLKKSLITVLGVVFGNLLVAIGVVGFIVPHGFVSGGATGISLALNHFTGMNLSLAVLIINGILFLLGTWQLGKKFAVSTILSTIVYPTWIEICENLPFLQGLTENPLIAMVYGGVLIGLGVGIVIRVGASTGGTDVLALVLNKYTHAPVSVTLYIVDFLVILTQMLFCNSEQMLLGVLMLFITSFAIGKVTVLGQAQTQLFIISAEYEKIKEAFLTELEAGATLVKIRTGKNNTEQEGVLCVIPSRKLYDANQIVQSIDDKAFMTISQINEVKGRGFSLDRNYKVEQ